MLSPMSSPAYTDEVKRVADLLMDEDLPTLSSAEIVRFVVSNYKPPFVWTEEPPNPNSLVAREQFTYTYRASTVIAGKLLAYQGFETVEMRRRGPGAVRLKAHIRHRLGAVIAEFLDSDV